MAGAQTFLSRFMLIEPYALFNEESHLHEVGVHDAFNRLLIDGRCAIITPAHQAANRLREIARGTAAHGTCGMGVGEAVQDSQDDPELMLHAVDLCDTVVVSKKLKAVCDRKNRELRDLMTRFDSEPSARFSANTLLDRSWIDAAVEVYASLGRAARVLSPEMSRDIVNEQGTVLYEGAQGVLLDESFGFAPHTTWSNTTFANALSLMDEAAFAGRRSRLGVLRPYFTRHGPGPFVTEDDALRSVINEAHNGDAGSQGRFRVGAFDAVATRYAIDVAGPVDFLAVTHLDQLGRLPGKICTAYRFEESPDLEVQPSDYFAIEGDKIAQIRRHALPDLHHQTRLGALLNRCRSIYREVPMDSTGAFLDVIREELGTEIAITSFGSAARDKRITNPVWLGK